jgi:hypothetical protein
MLIKIAKDHVARRIRREKDLVAVYLTGSVSEGEPLLGGSTDIDLIFVHKEEPPLKREVLRVTYEISLDIEHHHQSFYTYHRRLRQNPYIGHALCKHQNILLDNDHWLEFIQASVSSRFDSPENVYGRAQQFAEKARTQWFDLDDPQEVAWEAWVALYFKTVGTAANAIACLNGPALTARRFMLDFTTRAETLERLPLVGDLTRLLGNENMNEDLFKEWRPVWEGTLAAANEQSDCPPNISKVRKAYFLHSVDAMAESGTLHAVLWPMLETWQQALTCLEDEKHHQNWQYFLDALDFQVEKREELLRDLDHFIDQAEHLLEGYKNEYNL